MLLLYAPGAPAHASPPGPGLPSLDRCRRDEGSLTRYLLCLELEARRTHADRSRYYADLGRLDAPVIERLSRSPMPGPRLLASLHRAGARGARERPTLTLVEMLDGWRSAGARAPAADCDVWSLLNLGAAEQRYGTGDSPVRIVRTSHDHVVTAFVKRGSVVGVLDTVDGTIRFDPRGVYRGVAPPDEATAAVGYHRPMSERAITALYLANIGLALADEGREAEALLHFDASLALNGEEFVAHVGRSRLDLDRSGLASASCDGPAPRGQAAALLDRAAASARRAIALAPDAPIARELMARIHYLRCESTQAQTQIEQAMRLRADPVHYYYLALILDQRGEPAEAIRTLRRGRALLSTGATVADPLLEQEMVYLLAHLHAGRAYVEGSRQHLGQAMRHASSLADGFADLAQVRALRRAIDDLDRRIGPIRRDRGLPAILRRPAVHAFRRGAPPR